MSQQAIDHCSEVKKLIQNTRLKEQHIAYPVVSTSIEKARQFYQGWIDVYAEYEKGLEILDLPSDTIDWRTKSASIAVDARENDYKNIVSARIPVETYLLLASFFSIFRIEPKFIIHEERNRFETTNLYEEMEADFLKLPAPQTVAPTVKGLKTVLKDSTLRKISYNATVFDSPQDWLMLLHEGAHEIYDSLSLYTINPQQTSLSSMELLLDLLVCNVFGPAYSVALAKYHRKYPGGSGETHPKEVIRLYAMLRYAQTLPNPVRSESSKKFSQKVIASDSILSALWKSQKDNAAQEDLKDVDEVFDKIMDGISQYLRKSNIPNFVQFIDNYDQAIPQDKARAIDLDTAIEWIDESIPLAIDPRIFFNAVLDKETINPMLVTESLKRWYVVSKWEYASKSNFPASIR